MPYTRSWGTDPWTQGYVTAWRPGDVMGVGPLRGKSEPPFYVCGSDQWLSGHMEGAVRAGRGVAREILASRWWPALATNTPTTGTAVTSVALIPTTPDVDSLLKPSDYIDPANLRTAAPAETAATHLASADEKFSVGTWRA